MARGKIYSIESKDADKELDTLCYHDGNYLPCRGKVWIAVGYPGWPYELFLCAGHRQSVRYGPEYTMRSIRREVNISGELDG